MSLPVGMIIPIYYGNMKFMFQSTNQLRYIIHCNKNWIQWIIASIIKNGWGK
jgi:hypothetical protein